MGALAHHDAYDDDVPTAASTPLLPRPLAHRYREAELKHGRVAMLAAWGMITADSFHPLFGGKNSANPWLAATQVPKLGWLQILTFIMFMEVIGILNSRRPDYEPGNFLGSSQWETDEGWVSYQTKELNNGRLASKRSSSGSSCCSSSTEAAAPPHCSHALIIVLTP